jgi:hypothetical protein
MDIETKLEAIFDYVNRWLEFAERKNTYIFTFFSLIVIFTPFIEKLTTVSNLIKMSITILYGFYFLAMAATMLSFFPITKISKKLIERGKDKKLSMDDNLIYYGHIYKYSQEEYIIAFREHYNIELPENKLVNDLIIQIIVNANITRNKMEYFKISIVFTFLALLQFAICFAINLLS